MWGREGKTNEHLLHVLVVHTDLDVLSFLRRNSYVLHAISYKNFQLVNVWERFQSQFKSQVTVLQMIMPTGGAWFWFRASCFCRKGHLPLWFQNLPASVVLLETLYIYIIYICILQSLLHGNYLVITTLNSELYITFILSQGL